MDHIFGSNEKRRAVTTAREAERATEKSTRLEHEVGQLRRRVERLSLMSQALWELIRETTDLSDEDIEKKTLEIDERGDAADGRITPELLACPECDRCVTSNHESCLYCGATLDRRHLFE